MIDLSEAKVRYTRRLGVASYIYAQLHIRGRTLLDSGRESSDSWRSSKRSVSSTEPPIKAAELKWDQ